MTTAQKLQAAWKKRQRLRARADKNWHEGDFLLDKAETLRTEGLAAYDTSNLLLHEACTVWEGALKDAGLLWGASNWKTGSNVFTFRIAVDGKTLVFKEDK
jgi:hypothetical protein